MPRETVHRTLTMRSAVSATDFCAKAGSHGSLESLLRHLHGRFKTIAERRALTDGQVVEGRNILRSRTGHTFLHFVAYTPDDKISVVPEAGDVSDADLALVAPPKNADFLDGELMLLVKDNDVLMCRSDLSESAFLSYVSQLAQRARVSSVDSTFHLMKRADVDKLEMIRNEGVKSVSMNAIANEASITRLKRGRVEHESFSKRVVGSVLEEISAILGLEDDIPAEAENLKVEVLLSFDKRKGTDIDQRQIEFIAEQMLADEKNDGFAIETLTGRKIRADDIVLSKPVKFAAYGKSVQHKEAWAALRAFYDELTAKPLKDRA